MEGTRIKPNIDLDWLKMVLTYELDLRRKLLDLVDRQIEKDMAEFAQNAETITGQLEDTHQRERYLDAFLEEYFERESYQVIFLHAFFASSFAQFEHELVRVCEWAREEAETPFSVKDLGRRDYMNNVKRYLKKLGVGFPASTYEWNQALVYRTIRNKIMHEGSSLGENDRIFNFAKENRILFEAPGIDGNKEFDLQLTRAFCEKALDDFQKVLVQVYSAYERWHKERTGLPVRNPTRQDPI